MSKLWYSERKLHTWANGLFSLTCLCILITIIWWIIHRPYFDLKTVYIQSWDKDELRHVSELSLRDNALRKIEGNFFTVNLNEARSILETVPWARKAVVQRVWPNKLIIKIQEHEVLGTWGTEGQLLSRAGDVFTANLAEAEDDVELIEFAGPLGSEKEVVEHFEKFKNWFKPLNLTPIKMEYSNRYAWVVYLDNGLQIDLGREQEPNSLQNRVKQFIQIYPDLLNRMQGNIDKVDLRYPNGIAIKANKLIVKSSTKSTK